jgi:type VI secretion system secreted protein Hcp
MKYGEIKGDVTAEGHKGEDGWVEVDSFKFGIGRGIDSPTGGSADRESSAPSVSEIFVTKPSDVSSTALVEASLWGEGVDVTIDFCKTDKDKLEIYQYYKLWNAMVSSMSFTSGGDRTRETLALNFTKFEYGVNQQSAKGEKAETPKTAWDIGLAKQP